MVIRPMAAAYAMGEIGRSAGTLGVTSGPAAFMRENKDEVEIGKRSTAIAGLYTGSPLFKIMGAVELTSEEQCISDNEFGDLSFLD